MFTLVRPSCTLQLTISISNISNLIYFRFQYGRHQDYLVELEGLDPWAAGAVELVAGNTTVDESIYVPGLQAFTSYLLRVFGRNQGGLVSRVPLDIRATTRATVPEPPDNIQLKARA